MTAKGPCQLQIGTYQEHLPMTEKQGHLPSASAVIEHCAALAV